MAWNLPPDRSGMGGVFGTQGLPPWLQSGLVDAPPEQDEMSRALPGYEQRDPRELAAMRLSGSVRPNAGRADFPPEHLANMATAALMFTPAGYALAPEMAIGRGLVAGAQYAPKLATGAALGGAAYLSQNEARGAENQFSSLPKDPKQIMELQSHLKANGYPIEAIDGIIKPGGPTERSFKQYQADQAARRAEELQRQQLETQQSGNAATLETARANQATALANQKETDRKAKEAADFLARKQAGDERMRDIEKNLSPVSRAIRDYSGPAGYVLGGAVGAASRYGITSTNNYFSRARAAAGDATMAEEIAGPAASVKGVARTAAQDAVNLKRVARANEFWRKGAGEVPFLLNAEKAPGFAVNPKASPLSSTYNPNVHPAVEGTATVLPAGEATWAHFNEQDARQEVKDSIAAYGTDPTEANIQRINKANDNAAIWEGASNFGRMWAGSQLLGAVGSRFTKAAPGAVPNMSAAEAEQLSLQKTLRDYQEKIDKAAKKSNASPVARALVGPPTPAPGFTGAAATTRRTISY